MKSFFVVLMFFVSGMTSLVYQALWIRSLSLGVGSSSESMAIVLAIFFAGLSLGSYWMGKRVGSLRKPILFYGFLEAAIGIYALGLIYVLTNFHQILAFLPLSGSFSWWGSLCKYLLVAACLFLPTVGMGASLPLLIHHFVKRQGDMGQWVSRLYGINTLGAVFGAFLAGFYFIPRFGLLTANHLMVLCNGLILPLAWYLQKIHQVNEDRDGGHLHLDLPKALGFMTSSKRHWIYLGCAVTGFSSIAAEVTWNKYLGIFLGSNIFGLSLILSLFLLGIALGSLWLSLFVDRVKNLIGLYLTGVFLASVMMYGASYLLNMAPLATHVAAYYLGGLLPLLWIKAIVVGLILFLPTCFFGGLLPLAIRLLSEDVQKVSAVTGRAYAINTVGSILGSAVAGLLVIPLWGSGLNMQLAVGVLLVYGLTLTYVFSQRLWIRWGYRGVLSLMLVGLWFSGTIRYQNIVKSAYFQSAPDGLTLKEALRFFDRDSEEFVFIHEGKNGIISLSQNPIEAENWKDYWRLKTNGLNESLYDLKNLTSLPKYEALLGLLPSVFVEDPQKVFVVGYGGGYTVDLFTSLGIPEVQVVELEEGIIKAAELVYKGENPILKRSNLQLDLDDARFALATRNRGPFDIVVSQPSHSWLAGVANLFTQEYFEIVKDNLTSRGVFSQWLNLYNMDPRVLKSLLKTFFDSFPHGAAFSDIGDGELILIGSLEPKNFDLSKLENWFKDPRFAASLSYDFKSAHDVLSTYMLSRDRVREISEGAVINTDINAYAEVQQSRIFYSKNPQKLGDFLVSNYVGDYEKILSEDLAGDKEFQLSALEHMKNYSSVPGGFRKFQVQLDKFAKANSRVPSYWGLLGKYNFYLERLNTAEDYLFKAVSESQSQMAFDLLLQVHLRSGAYDKIEKLWGKYPALRGAWGQCIALEMWAERGQWFKAKRLAEVLENNAGTAVCGSQRLRSLGIYYFLKGHREKAISHLEEYFRMFPEDLRPLEYLSAALLAGNHKALANYYLFEYRRRFEGEKLRLENLHRFFSEQGLVDDAEGVAQRLKLFTES